MHRLSVWPAERLAGGPRGHRRIVFLFFTSRLGCLGSLLVSVLLTLLLYVLFTVL